MSNRMTMWVLTAALLATAPDGVDARQRALAIEPAVPPAPALEARAVAWPLPPELIRQDPADSLYRAAREALADRSYRRAIDLYAQIRSDYPRSAYVADSYYWQAQALHRIGARSDLDRAMALLATQAERHPDAVTGEDAEALRVRIQAQMARRGDAGAAQQIARLATSEGRGDGDPCEENDIRSAALSALLQMDPERARPILMELLEERGECTAELREQAVFLLAQNPDAETVRILVDLAQRNPDPDEDVREAAVFWLSQIPGEEALDALMRILESGAVDGDLRERAVYAVAQHDSPRVAEILLAYARGSDQPIEIREQAIFWLGQQHDAGSALRELWGSLDTAPELKEQVLLAVSQERTPDATAWLVARATDPREDEEIRKTALFWAGESGITVGELLGIYGSSTDAELREQAIFVISQSKTTEAVDALMNIAREEEDPELKEQAIFWLGQSRDPRVAEFLLELIRGGG